MSKSPRTNLIRAVRLLPEAVKVGLGPLPDETVELLSPVDPGRESAVRDEHAGLLDEVERLRESIRRVEQENRDLAARVALSEKELSDERRRLEADRQRMKADMEAEAESVRKAAEVEGAERGRSAGYEEGARKAREEIALEYEQKVSSLVALLESVHASLDQSAEELANLGMPRLIRLWERMLSRMLRREVELSDDTVQRVLRGILERLSDRDRILVYLNPADAERTSGRRDVFGDLLLGVKHLEFIPDVNVEEGSCIVETNLGIYDARWRTQLEQIHQEIDHLFVEGRKDDSEDV
ncbi:MAG: flagellar assembly protein H [Synergistetes bacterium ADurb.BinA166]|nr:MAG: flagellar assembly protein H [Synergistetes bacterium ADurb.BinA166]